MNNEAATATNAVKQHVRKLWLKRILFLIFGLSTGIVLGLHFLPGSILKEVMVQSGERAGFDVDGPKSSHLSLISAHANISDYQLFKNNETHALCDIERISFQGDRISFLFSDAYIVDSLTITNPVLNFRSSKPFDGSWENYFLALREDILEALGKHPPATQRQHIRFNTVHIDDAQILWPRPSLFDIQQLRLRGENIGNARITEKPSTLRINFNAQDIITGEIYFSDDQQTQYFECEILNISAEHLFEAQVSEYINTYISKLGISGTLNVKLIIQTDESQRQTTLNIRSRDVRLQPPQHDDWFMRSVFNVGQQIELLHTLEPQAEISWSFNSTGKYGQKAIVDYGIADLFKSVNQRITEIKTNK